MFGRREKASLALILLLVVTGYAISWLHYRTIPSQGRVQEVVLRNGTFEVSANSISCILGREVPIAHYSEDLTSDFYLRVSYGASALRNVVCNQFQISGGLYLLIQPPNDSIAIRRVVLILENDSHVTIDNLFPLTEGILYLKTSDGSFEMTPGNIPNHSARQVMVIRALKPTWGKAIETEPYVELSIEKHWTEKEIRGKTKLIIKVEYLVRTGFFKSEKRTLKVEVPMTYVITGLDSCGHDCES